MASSRSIRNSTRKERYLNKHDIQFYSISRLSLCQSYNAPLPDNFKQGFINFLQHMYKGSCVRAGVCVRQV